MLLDFSKEKDPVQGNVTFTSLRPRTVSTQPPTNPFAPYVAISPIGKGSTFASGYYHGELSQLPNEIRQDPRSAKAMHGAVYLGYLLLSSNLATVGEILGDYGLVHELAHWQEFNYQVSPKSASVDELANLAQALINRLN